MTPPPNPAVLVFVGGGPRTVSLLEGLAANSAELLPAPWALTADAAAAVTAVRSADVLILATPTYKASSTGLLKLLLDSLPAGSLDHTVVIPLTVSAGPAPASRGLAATAGSG